VLGCNFAWGLIDGAMFLTARLLERSRAQRKLRALHRAADDATALAVVDDAIEEAIGGDVTAAATAEERMRLAGLVRDMALRVPLGQPRLRREDLLGAVASAVLVMLATIPAAVPFLLIDAPWRALRLSNLLLLVMLFLVGYQWGQHSYTNRWRAGLAFLVVGMALVGAAIALGG
jgi:VIT1/CCC1 family predicted Fe2+/Mn2+ transporter